MEHYLFVILLIMDLILATELICTRISWREAAKEQDYKIHQSFSRTGGGYEKCTLRVIVCVEDYDMEEMFYQIKSDHDQLNGESDELEIWLYNSKEDLINGQKAGEKTYYGSSEMP